MRNCKWPYLHLSDCNGHTVSGQAPIQTFQSFPCVCDHGVQSTPTRPYRNAKLATQGAGGPPPMIAVFVRDKDGIEVGQIQATGLHSILKLGQTQAAINQYMAAADTGTGLDQGGIARAAAAQVADA